MVHEGRIIFAGNTPEHVVTVDEVDDVAAFGPLYDLSQPDCGAVEIQYRSGNGWVTL